MHEAICTHQFLGMTFGQCVTRMTTQMSSLYNFLTAFVSFSRAATVAVYLSTNWMQLMYVTVTTCPRSSQDATILNTVTMMGSTWAMCPLFSSELFVCVGIHFNNTIWFNYLCTSNERENHAAWTNSSLQSYYIRIFPSHYHDSFVLSVTLYSFCSTCWCLGPAGLAVINCHHRETLRYCWKEWWCNTLCFNVGLCGLCPVVTSWTCKDNYHTLSNTVATILGQQNQ